jgi:type I restriction enzyme, S subunit
MWVNNGSVGVSPIEGVISPDYRVYDLRADVLPSYAHRVFRSHLYRSLYAVLTRGHTTYDRRVGKDDFNSLPFLVPPLPTQRAIAAFLDRKTAAIDALIKKKERLIALLVEKRASLIHQAVTKGLDRNVPMKDSGVQWIGEVPAHWHLEKFKRAAFFQEGPGLRNWQFTEAGVPVICVSNITQAGIDFGRYRKFVSEEEFRGKYRHFTVNSGDLLLSSSGNSWGKVAEFRGSQPTMLNTSTIRVNEARNRVLAREFIRWVLAAEATRKQLGLMMTGACQPNFGPSHLAKVMVAVPSAKEQLEVAELLLQRTTRIDDAVSKLDGSIDTLHEYRQALITAAVTGQLQIPEEAA